MIAQLRGALGNGSAFLLSVVLLAGATITIGKLLAEPPAYVCTGNSCELRSGVK